ncbi:hypothetical protein GQ55_5G307700 [Panicum hallii var. hallii]|uniref:Uncharacterized protein n=1 Tax=Panicum hallii var. hallii TaxID=1504633 RepID=A0A2T7DLM0_9POAL|nr:hypothetical protein GQ55_5G307700 [Panicum hallii var. hallii]
MTCISSQLGDNIWNGQPWKSCHGEKFHAPIENQVVDHNERRRERARARRAAMTAEQRDITNKRRRDSYHAHKEPKKTMSAEEKKQKVNIRSDTLHPDSIAMENPHFKPELIFPTPLDKPLSAHDKEIPVVNGTPVYIHATLEDPPHEVDPLILVGRKKCSQQVTPGMKGKLRSLRTKQFESTIGRSMDRSHEETRCNP